MTLIGLCGRSGSGKSVCGRFISDMGFAVIDSDKVYHALTKSESELLKELTDFFGKGILDKNGNLDRRELSGIVFQDDKLLLQLNKITHKHILNSIIEWAKNAASNSRGNIAVVQAPLLFESGLNKLCDINVCVLASDEHCLRRMQTRDGFSYEQAKIRLSKQKDNAFLKQNCDYVINNDSDIDKLKKETETVFCKILKR